MGQHCYHFWSAASMQASKKACVFVSVTSTSLPTPPFLTSSKMLKCAHLKHDTFSMKRKKKKKKPDRVNSIKIPSFSWSRSLSPLLAMRGQWLLLGDLS